MELRLWSLSEMVFDILENSKIVKAKTYTIVGVFSLKEITDQFYELWGTYSSVEFNVEVLEVLQTRKPLKLTRVTLLRISQQPQLQESHPEWIPNN